jgi:hypothetical protein
MSAWGSGVFENDNALDWVSELTESDNPSFIAFTLEDALHNPLVQYQTGFTDTFKLDTALVAAKIIAALQSTTTETLPTQLQSWIVRYTCIVTPTTLQLAVDVVAKVLQEETLHDIWADPADYALWRRGVEELQLRLQV